MHEPDPSETLKKEGSMLQPKRLLALPLIFVTSVVACTSDRDSTQSTPPGAPSTPPSSTDAPPPSPPAAQPPLATAPADVDVEPGPPAVRFIGRSDDRHPEGPTFGWPGARIIANFDGTQVSVRMNETAYLDGPSEWDVAIDNEWRPKVVMQVGDHVYPLASDLPKGHHRVELYKRSEGQNGVTQYLGYDFHGGTLLPPPRRSSRKLEIIGDSDVAGFGYEGAALNGNCPGAPWAAHYENFRMAWGARLATKLDAELHGTVYSGKGFYFNIWRPDDETIGVVFPRAEPTDPTSVYDLSKFIPDAVVLAIGGNDYNIGLPEDNGPPPLAGVTQKARELTAKLRQAYPHAYLFLMAYAVLTDTDPPGRLRRTNIETALKTVLDEHLATGDARVAFVAPPQYDPAELIGCDGHGGPSYHERISRYLATEMAKRLGW